MSDDRNVNRREGGADRAPADRPSADLDAALAALPRVGAPADAAAATGRLARRLFLREAALRDRPLARAWEHGWVRRAEPALLAVASGYYFVWALATVTALGR